VLAATDLTNHLACAHPTQQRLAIVRGEPSKPRPADDPHADLVRERGERHEAEQRARLGSVCGGHAIAAAARPGRCRSGHREAGHHAPIVFFAMTLLSRRGHAARPRLPSSTPTA